MATTLLVFQNAIVNVAIHDDAFFVPGSDDLSLQGVFRHFTEDAWATAGVSSGVYRPCLKLSFAIDQAFFGRQPAGYHRINVAWHVLVVGLLWTWLYLLRHRRTDWITPSMVALFFGLHPIHTEAVNSIYNRSEMMVSAFALMALLLAHIGWRRFPLWSAVGGAWLYGLALFTRESAVTIPLWVGGFVWLQFQGMPGTMARRHKAPFVLFALPLLIYLGLRASALAGRIAGAEPPLGVTEVDAGVGRIHISVATVIEYVRMMVWPWPLRISWENFSGAIHPIGALVAIFLVIRGWRLRKSMPQVGLATFLFFLSLLPSTRLFTSSDLLVKWGDWTMLQAAPGLVLVGERVAYFPSIAAALLINSALSANCSPKGRV